MKKIDQNKNYKNYVNSYLSNAKYIRAYVVIVLGLIFVSIFLFNNQAHALGNVDFGNSYNTYTNTYEGGAQFPFHCDYSLQRTTGNLHDNWNSTDNQWVRVMWNFQLNGTETTGAHVDGWYKATDLFGARMQSFNCNGGKGLAGDQVNVSTGDMNLVEDGRKPIDLHLGALNEPNNSNGRWANPAFVGFSDPYFNPFVFGYNWLAPAAAVDDAGGFYITSGGGAGTYAAPGTNVIWCINSIDLTMYGMSCPYLGQAGKDVTNVIGDVDHPYGEHAFLMSKDNCQLGNPAAITAGVPSDAATLAIFGGTEVVAQCAGGHAYDWESWAATTDLTQYTGYSSNTHIISNFQAHTSAENTLSGGWGADTYVQASYPNQTFAMDAYCTSVNYGATSPFATAANMAAFPGQTPVVTLTFQSPGYSDVVVTDSGKFADFVAIPASLLGFRTLTVTATTNMDGQTFNITKSVNCVALTCTSSISSITAIRDQNMDIPLSITIDPSTYNIPGGTISYQYNGGAIVTLSNFGSKTGIIDQKILALNINQSLGSATLTYWINTTNALTGNDQVVSQPLSISPCTITINATTEPTISVNGGDVVAGSIIDSNVTNCTDPYSDTNGDGIFTYNLGATGSYLGSGTSLAAQALGAITGFPTNLLAATKNNLDFADDGSGNYGGFGYAPCISIPTSLPSSNLGTIGQPAGLDIINLNTFNGTYSATSNASDYFSLGANTLSLSKDIVIYVDGNVSINDNQTYTTSGWNTVSAIPNLKIIASGDIYISPKVTQLDGTYIATGSIYTCSYTEQDYTAGNYANLANVKKYVNGTPSPCLSNLLVNGSLIAKSIYLQRTYGNVGAATPTAAETINYGPEDWLATVTTNTGTVDSYQELPPVL